MWQCQNAMRLEADDKRVMINAVVDENCEVPGDFLCQICLCFAADPLVCGNCETAMTCKACFESWKMQKGRQSVCPSCKATTAPKKMIKILHEHRNALNVRCSRKDCPLGGRVISYAEYEDHI